MASTQRHAEFLEKEAAEERTADEVGLELLMEHHRIRPGPLTQRYRELAVAMARISVPGFRVQKSRPGRPASAWRHHFLIIALVHGLRSQHGSLKAAADWLDAKPLAQHWPPVATVGFYEAYRAAWKCKEARSLKQKHGIAGAVRQITARVTAALAEN